MFIIGKNFMKGTIVVFEEVKNDHVVWSSEAEIDLDFFQAVSILRDLVVKCMTNWSVSTYLECTLLVQ